MSNPKWEEIIVVAKREDIFNGTEDEFQGLLTDKETMKRIADRFDNFTTKRRGHSNDPTPAENNAEINFEYKQPIPYVVIRRGDEIFVYKRLSGGGEVRLFDKLSIGAGGHMNPIEEITSFPDLFAENMCRELDEELTFTDESTCLVTIGLINDDSDEVGKVHFGILVVAFVYGDVSVQETDQLKGEWMTIEELRSPEVYDKLENWSKLALQAL